MFPISQTRVQIADQTVMFDSEVNDLRWFLLPSEALLWLQNPQQAAAAASSTTSPFHPVTYPRMDLVDRSLSLDSEHVQCIKDSVALEVNSRVNHPGSDPDVEFTSSASDVPEEVTTNIKVTSRANNNGEVRAVSKFQEGMMASIQTGFGEDVLSEATSSSEKLDPLVPSSTECKQPVVAIETDICTMTTAPEMSKAQDTKSSTDDKQSGQSIKKTTGDAPTLRPSNDTVPVDPSRESSLVSSDNVCNLKSKPVPNLAEGHRWHAPPKEIFKQTLKVKNSSNLGRSFEGIGVM